MAQSLPTTTGDHSQYVTRLCQRLEFFASHTPEVIKPLSLGQPNQNYYIATGRAEYVMRVYPERAGFCHQQELRCQHAAAVAGLAPAPLCLNNHLQVLISEFIPSGEPFNYQQHDPMALIRQLARLHRIKIQTPVLQPSAYIKHQLSQLSSATADDALVAQLLDSASQLAALPEDNVLCHLDLHTGNLLWAQNQLWLLDFEYAQLAERSFDLAAVCLHFQLSGEDEQAFISRYCKEVKYAEPQQLLQQKITLCKQLYSGFCWLWYLALPQCAVQSQYWQQMLKQQLV